MKTEQKLNTPKYQEGKDVGILIDDHDDEMGYRFKLGEAGERNLVCIGLNPSKGNSGKYDPTMNRLKGMASFWGYDGYVMLNLYPQRSTNPSDMDDFAHCDRVAMARNIEAISEVFRLGDFDVWAAWGANVGKRRNRHLQESLSLIWKAFNKERGDRCDVEWIRFGEYSGGIHPRHPLRVSYLSKVSERNHFDVELYLEQLKSL